jgi:hypothetical protein
MSVSSDVMPMLRGMVLFVNTWIAIFTTSTYCLMLRNAVQA